MGRNQQINTELSLKMKTKLLITITIGLILTSGFAFIYNEMSDCLNPPGWLKIPRPVNFSDCLEQFANGNLPHYTRDNNTSSKEIIQIIQVIKPNNETLENFEGVIFDKRLGPVHWYNFFTNDHFKTFNTGTTGITLKGINSMDDLHGAIVNISGIRTDRDLGIQVYELQIFDSLIPSSTTGSVSNAKHIFNVSLDNLYDDPDSYYNRFIRITGELREHEREVRYAGTGCDTAKYTTSDEFTPDGPSSRQLYVGEKFVGIRIDSHNDVGKVENELTSELKNKQVEIMGIFVPHIVDKGGCEHVIHKSGYILTKLDDIKIPSEDVPVESEKRISEASTFGNDYDEYGLRINSIELREVNLGSMIKYKDYSTTKIDKNSVYTFVIEVQNRDGMEKDFYGMTSWIDPNGDSNGSGMKGTIGPYETMLVDTGGSYMYPGEIPVDVILYEHLSVRKDAIPLSQVFVLEEK